jgi:hypothetical protein
VSIVIETIERETKKDRNETGGNATREPSHRMVERENRRGWGKKKTKEMNGIRACEAFAKSRMNQEIVLR